MVEGWADGGGPLGEAREDPGAGQEQPEEEPAEGQPAGEPEGTEPAAEEQPAEEQPAAAQAHELFAHELVQHWASRMHAAEEVKREQALRLQLRQQRLQERQPTPPVVKKPLLGGGEALMHNNPERPVMYGSKLGGERAPVLFLEAASPALTNYLRYDPLGPFAGGLVEWTCSTQWSWAEWGFAEDKEHVLKADWHAVPSGTDEADIFVPRLARVKTMRRAPPRIEAFAEAFRSVNREVWSCIVDHLLSITAGNSLPTAIAMAIANDHSHFGSIEAQVRWGDEELRLPSHLDGATSLLHLGMTLAGERSLRLGVFPTPQADPKSEANVWDEDLWSPEHLKEEKMTPGKAYLSSPFCFEHAVEYQRTRNHEPVIALQFRLGFRGDVGQELNNARGAAAMHWVARVIAGVLKVAVYGGWIRMPTLDELRSAEARLASARRVRSRAGVRGHQH